MRKTIVTAVAFVVLGALLAGCGTPPPLKSDKYLADTSLLTQNPCGAPCFHGITAGQTTYTDALSKIKADAAFSNVQNQDKPPAASWSTKAGDACCQLSADETTGLVNALLVKVTPSMTVKDVIAKYGDPKYVSPVDYTDKEVAMALVFPDKGLVTWVSPGDSSSTLTETTPVVMVLYLNPQDWSKVMDTATLMGWNGYMSYSQYKTVTPVITPRVTITPSS